MARLPIHLSINIPGVPGAGPRTASQQRHDIMVIAIDGKWIWDSWYAHDGQHCHGFFLQADRSPDRPRPAPSERDAGPCGVAGPDQLDPSWHHVRPAAQGPGLGRQHHLDRVGGAGRRGAVASVLHRHHAGRKLAVSAHRPCHLDRSAHLGAGGRRAVPGPDRARTPTATKRTTWSATGTTGPCATLG